MRLYGHVDIALAEGEDGVGMPQVTSKPMLILLPGLDGTGKLFTDFLEALGSGIDSRIVAYPVDRRLGYTELEHLVRSTLPSDRRYVVLGESFSGPIAIRIAADPPSGLVGVILCVSFAKNPFPLPAWLRPLVGALPVKSMPRWVRSLFMWGSKSANRAPEQVNRATAAVDDVVLRHRIGEVLAVDATAALERIEVPMLVVQATADNVVPSSATPYMLRMQPRARHLEIDGPHLLLQTRPAECATAVAHFLREVYDNDRMN